MHRKILNGTFKFDRRTALFLLLAAISIMCMPACSSDSDNAAVQPNYIVQATVSVEEDGPVAYALVMDGDQNLVSTLNLTINGEPMSIEYDDANEESTETGDRSPYYIMDLPDLKGGDMVVFEARDQFGAIIYAPEPAVIPMAIEFLEPQEGTEIVAGDEVVISWTGGEGAELFSAAYAALDGSAVYRDVLASGGGSVTIPTGQTVQGDAVLGVGAISGDIHVMNSFDGDFISRESYFLVSREMGITATVLPTGGVASSAAPATPTCDEGTTMKIGFARAACVGEFAAFGIGAIVWENRRQCDLNHPRNESCRKETTNFTYCENYAVYRGHDKWYAGCLACSACIKCDKPHPDGWMRCRKSYNFGAFPGDGDLKPRPCKPKG